MHIEHCYIFKPLLVDCFMILLSWRIWFVRKISLLSFKSIYITRLSPIMTTTSWSFTLRLEGELTLVTLRPFRLIMIPFIDITQGVLLMAE